jgi:hypothetical protein
MSKEFYYQRKISNYAEINNNNFNQYSEKIFTKNLNVIGLLETDSGNGIVQLFSPFVQRSTTVSKNPLSGSILVYGGTSLLNGNINVLGEKNPINFFQSSVKANSLISFEGMQVNKDFLTYTLETQSNASIVDIKSTINNGQSLITDLSELISLSDVFIGNELKGTNLFTIHNITTPNIINPNVIFTKNALDFNNINTNVLNINNLQTDNLITNQVFINIFNNLNGNVDAIDLNVNTIQNYQNIKSKELFVEQEIRELKNIPYANVTISTSATGTIVSNTLTTNSGTVTNYANITGTTLVGNIITTQTLWVDLLTLFNLNITSALVPSMIENIEHTGTVIINNKFNVGGNIFSGNVKNISYYDNMIPINLKDNNQLRDTGYQYNYLEGNIGIIYRKQYYNDNIIGNVNNTFIIGKFDYQDPIFSTINLLDVYANAVYGDIISNTLSLGITNNVFIGNSSLQATLYGNIYTNNSFISNLIIDKIISNNLNTNKNIIGNILFSDYLEGNVRIPNIDSNSLSYTNLTSNLLSANILNLSGNLFTTSTLNLTKSNMIINTLISPNLLINNLVISTNIITDNILAGNILSNIHNTKRATVMGNINTNTIYTSVNYINGNTDFDDYEISVINNNQEIQANLYQPPIGDIQIFDQYYKKSYNSTLLNNINNITLSTSNPLIKTIFNNKFLIMKNKNRSFNFNPYNNIQNIQLNETINHIASSYNGEVLAIDTIGNNIVYRLNYSNKQYNLIATFQKSFTLNNTKTIDLNIDGNTVVISDPMFNNQSGNIIIYTYDGIQYNYSINITGTQNSRLGYNVGIFNEKIIGSAPDNGTFGGGGNNNGNVYIYNNNLVTQYIINHINIGKEFGKNISITNKNLAIADRNNIYTFNNNTLIGNIIINGTLNNIQIDDSNNFIILNGNLNNTAYRLRTNTIVFSSNNTIYRGQSIINGDGSYLYNLYDGYLMKNTNQNGNFMIEEIYDIGIRGNNIINVTRNGNFMYVANNNGNVYVYN